MRRRRDAYHQALLAPIVASGAHTVWLMGEQMEELCEPLRKQMINAINVKSAQQLRPALAQELQAGDWVAFKGSNKFALGDVIQALISGKP